MFRSYIDVNLQSVLGENIMNERGRVQKEGISRFPVLDRLQSREPLRTVFG